MGKKNSPYAYIPLEVIESAAVASLRGKALLILVRAAANYRHDRNGMLTATSKEMARVVSQRTLYSSAIPQLLERNLLIRTVQGRKNVSARYGLGWLPIGGVAADWLYDKFAIKPVIDTNAWRSWESPRPKKYSRLDFQIITGGRSSG